MQESYMRPCVLVLGVLVLAVGTACSRQGDLFGGGDGLTLSFEQEGGTVDLHWDGARKRDLRHAVDGETEEPFAYVSVGEGWMVYAVHDADAAGYLADLGLDCAFDSDFFTASVNTGYVGFQARLADGSESGLLFTVSGGPSEGWGDAFEGELDVGVGVWSGPFDRCGSDGAGLPTVFTASWSFEDHPHVVDRCFGCDLIEFDF